MVRGSLLGWHFPSLSIGVHVVCSWCKTTPKWVIKPPSSLFFLAILDPWGVFIPPGGGAITRFVCVGGGGGGLSPLGWFHHPLKGGWVWPISCEPE